MKGVKNVIFDTLHFYLFVLKIKSKAKTKS